MDPTVVDAFAKLGALGFALIGIWAFATGRIRVGSLVDKRELELVTERTEWRTMAETSIAKLGRLTDVLEATIGKKLGE